MPQAVFVPASAADLSLSFHTDVDAAAHGALLYRESDSRWHALAPGTSGHVLTAGGAGADPAWQAPVTDHGALTGLADDDHAQYIYLSPATNTRNLITGAGNINVLTVKAHATQTNDIFMVQNNAGVDLFAVNPSQLVRTQSPGGTVTSMLVRDDVGNDRWFVQSNAATFWSAIPATAGSTSNSPGSFTFRSSRWTGAANAFESMTVNCLRLDSGAGRTVLQVNDTAGVTAFAVAGLGSQVSVGFNTPSVANLAALGQFHVRSVAATTMTATFRGAASQSANLTEWHDSAGAVHGTISENGYWTTRKTSAPADAELATGEMALWFDSTAGSAQLRIKAKNASGTVVTGSVALA